MRGVLKYHGSKVRLSRHIVRLMPVHTCYVEPYGGSAAVLLRKQPAEFEVYNDISLALCTFFQVLRDRRGDLERLLHYTPHHRREYEAATETLRDAERVRAMVATDDGRLEVARLVYVASWQGRHWPAVSGRGGWRYQYQSNRDKNVNREWCDLSHLECVAERLRHVQIECDDALAVIRRYDTPETLYYVDPPYVLSTRGASWAGKTYAGEMSDEDHVALLDLLRRVQGMVILSGYRCDLYDDVLRGWERIDRREVTDGGHERTESIWLSPTITKATPRQAGLFE
ncbi:MAG: DNA methyltransferase [Rhodothermaceae bacterium]|nr:MAG: DNA methyltransferase [Rhodothermaceae bacterium]